MQNFHPILQPYLETLSMFGDFEEKREKCILIMTTNKKLCELFYQMHAGIPGIYINGTESTGNLYHSGTTTECKATAN